MDVPSSSVTVVVTVSQLAPSGRKRSDVRKKWPLPSSFSPSQATEGYDVGIDVGTAVGVRVGAGERDRLHVVRVREDGERGERVRRRVGVGVDVVGFALGGHCWQVARCGAVKTAP